MFLSNHRLHVTVHSLRITLLIVRFSIFCLFFFPLQLMFLAKLFVKSLAIILRALSLVVIPQDRPRYEICKVKCCGNYWIAIYSMYYFFQTKMIMSIEDKCLQGETFKSGNNILTERNNTSLEIWSCSHWCYSQHKQHTTGFTLINRLMNGKRKLLKLKLTWLVCTVNWKAEPAVG